MLIDKTHKKWAVFTLATALLLLLSYLIYNLSVSGMGGPSGGSIPGLIYGTMALALMVFASLLGARKKMPSVRIGRASTWMRGHLWLSLLLIPLVLFHSGFKVGGPLTLWIWITFIIVMASGLFGALLQHSLPRLMTEQVAMETIYDQIDHVVNQIRYEADVQVSQAVGPLGFELTVPDGVTVAKINPPKEAQPGADLLKQLYLERVRPSLDPRSKPEDHFASRERIGTFFSQSRLSLPPPFHPILANLSEMMEERRQLSRQKALHLWLHGWLFAHVPISAILMLLVLVHVFTSLWY